jgi:predicted CXXCH cytochrome family protein
MVCRQQQLRGQMSRGASRQVLRILATLAPALLLTARPGHAGDVAEAGVCASCHVGPVSALVEHGGHAAVLDCQSCHADRRPGRIGPRHRSIPRCSSCHDDERPHPPRARVLGRRAELKNCTRCHEAHGSPNLALVRTQMRAAGRFVPMRLTTREGAAPGGFTNPEMPGTGLCEVCHRTTRHYRRDGGGEEHFTEPCTDCHVHEAGFEPVVSDVNCGVCHDEQAARFTKPSRHSALLACSDCHADAGTPPGEGHRTTRPCADCHAGTATHAPAAAPCTQCHEPHGTDNAYLVVEELRTTQGPFVPIRFETLEGLADGSFASASAPGTGICEVCHTATAYYRADGGGAEHFTLPCLPCHRHGDGFLPE